MKSLIILNSSFFILNSLLASPFAPEPGVECVVYSEATSDLPLHVEQWTTNGTPTGRRWDFPASHTGHRSVVRLPGAKTNDELRAWIGSSDYTPGDPFGTSKSRSFQSIGITRSSPIFARVDLYADRPTDRMALFGSLAGDVDGRALTNVTDAAWRVAAKDAEHVRVVPYMVRGSLSGTDYVLLDTIATNRVVAEFDVNFNSKRVVTEADFIDGDKFDIDWDGFAEEILYNGFSAATVGDVTAVKYRLVFGTKGPVGRLNKMDTNTVVEAYQYLIERRFEPSDSRTIPSQLRSRPGVRGCVFSWRLGEDDVHGCSYTAFNVQVQVGGQGTNIVWNSGIVRAPPKDTDGRFVWFSDYNAPAQNLKWRVAMHNAKFKPTGRENMNGWSEWAQLDN